MADPAAEVLAEIRRILAAELDASGPVEPRHELAGELGVDSMGAIVLAVGLEDRFRVRLAEADAARVVTVGDLVDLVLRELRAQEAGAPGAAEGGP